MTHSRAALLAAALLIAPVTAANAQMIVGPAAGPGPGMGQAPPPGSSGMIVGPAVGAPPSGPAMGPGPSAGMPPCMQQFLPLRAEAEKRASVLQAGINKKKAQPELCQLFRSFSEAEAKVVKYAATNQTNCGIPLDAVAQMKKNHAKTNEIRDKVCTAHQQAPAGPRLGEALGFGSLPNAETTRSGTGTLDTLSGNPLAR
jgi:hypothetical protein